MMENVGSRAFPRCFGELANFGKVKWPAQQKHSHTCGKSPRDLYIPFLQGRCCLVRRSGWGRSVHAKDSDGRHSTAWYLHVLRASASEGSLLTKPVSL